MLVLYRCVQNSNSFDSAQSEVRKGTGSFTFIAVTHRTGWLQTSTFLVDRVTLRWSKPVAFLRLHLDEDPVSKLQFSHFLHVQNILQGKKAKIVCNHACASLMAFNVTLSIQYSSIHSVMSTNPRTLLISLCSTEYLRLQQWLPYGLPS